MEEDKFEKVASRIAADGKTEPLMVIDQAINRIVSSLADIGKALPDVVPSNDVQQKALVEIKDLLETTVAPYMLDVVKEFEIFEDET